MTRIHHNIPALVPLGRVLSMGDAVIDRDASRAERAHDLAIELREAAEEAVTIDDILEHLVNLTPEQKKMANRLIARGDILPLGRLLCLTHDQLVQAAVMGIAPRHVVLWDELDVVLS